MVVSIFMMLVSLIHGLKARVELLWLHKMGR